MVFFSLILNFYFNKKNWKYLIYQYIYIKNFDNIIKYNFTILYNFTIAAAFVKTAQSPRSVADII